MFFIVSYHLISYCLYLIPHDNGFDNIYESILPILHIGVILFILISGYYKIRPSISGLCKLLFIVFIYYLPIELIRCIHHNGNILSTIMFITNTPYWFIRTYLYLYIIAPLLNKFIETATQKSINLLLVALAVISIYFGSTRGDSSLIDGKNLVNFIFLYFAGYSLEHYRHKWQSISYSYLLVGFLLINTIVIISLLLYNRESSIGSYIWRLVFPYCSPILIFNAILVFMIFSKLNIRSAFINICASSMFSVYIIHCHPAFHEYIIMPICHNISSFLCHSIINYIGIVLLTTICLMALCVIIDKCCTPLWNYSNKLFKLLDNKITKMI